MAPYCERKLNLFWGIIILVAFFLLFFFPIKLGLRELRWQEGYYAALALEMGRSALLLPAVELDGSTLINNMPLFPLLAMLINKIGCPIELALRLISVVSLGITALVCAITVGAARDRSAAFFTAAMIISSSVILEKSMLGYPINLLVMIVICGQLLWFKFGAMDHNWTLGWLVGFLASALAFYCSGLFGLIYFWVPLIFLRRPLGIFGRLQHKGVYLGLLILLFFVLMWFVPFSYSIKLYPAQLYDFGGMISGSDYLLQLVKFPFELLLYSLPWALVMWAPFCVALFPLDETPILSRFLRTIAISSFFFIWLLPGANPWDVPYLLPALAMLCGMNYWIVIRRYGNVYMKILRIFPVPMMICGILIVLFYALPTDVLMFFFKLSGNIEFKGKLFYYIFGFVSGVGLILTGLLLAFRWRPPIWLYTLLIMLAPMLFYWTIAHPYTAGDGERRAFGQRVRSILNQNGYQNDEVVYKFNLSGLHTEMVYMDVPGRRIDNLLLLPGDKKQVFVLSSTFPQLSSRNWSNLLPENTLYRDNPINLWKGELKAEEKLEEVPDGDFK